MAKETTLETTLGEMSPQKNFRRDEDLYGWVEDNVMHGSRNHSCQLMRTKESLSNMDSFLNTITPVVKTQQIDKSSIAEVEITQYFRLGNLWDCFDEWSAYGVGVPYVFNGEDSVVQYYSPSLSAIQLYVPFTNLRYHGDDSSDDASNDNESLCEQCSLRREENGHLIFEHFELAPLNGRLPFSSKIFQLSQEFKELKSLRNIDLLPTSWVSIAWNPVYRIPKGSTLKDSATCFLTYHALSTTPQDNVISQGTGSEEGIAVKAFGLASYKYKESTAWTLSDAAPWLKQVHASKPDFFLYSSKCLEHIF